MPRQRSHRAIKRRRADTPEEVRLILSELDRVLRQKDDKGRSVSYAKFGVYAFYDYDDEPIYVGQTAERLSARISRHLTNQRTDAVAMNVLDPFEVAAIEMWPLWDLESVEPRSDRVKATLNSAEYTVYEKLRKKSNFNAVLNEVPIAKAATIQLPASLKARIVPNSIYDRRKHPDLRIARRASTIAKLAEVISERAVQTGLRNTLVVQAKRLQHLAEKRLKEVSSHRHTEDAQSRAEESND